MAQASGFERKIPLQSFINALSEGVLPQNPSEGNNRDKVRIDTAVIGRHTLVFFIRFPLVAWSGVPLIVSSSVKYIQKKTKEGG